MILRALRPPMLFGASLPGMIFPAKRPAEGSNSYHYGSHATFTWLVDNVRANGFPYHYGSHATGMGTQLAEAYLSFPYHYGSHATLK